MDCFLIVTSVFLFLSVLTEIIVLFFIVTGVFLFLSALTEIIVSIYRSYDHVFLQDL